MKAILAAVVLGFIALATTTASAQPLKQFETNWIEQIIQTLTGTQQQTVVPVTPQHRHTIHKKHRHYHHASVTTQRASAGVMKSHVHMSKKEKDKLFGQFEEWHQRQQLYQLFNPIE